MSKKPSRAWRDGHVTATVGAPGVPPATYTEKERSEYRAGWVAGHINAIRLMVKHNQSKQETQK